MKMMVSFFMVLTNTENHSHYGLWRRIKLAIYEAQYITELLQTAGVNDGLGYQSKDERYEHAILYLLLEIKQMRLELESLKK